MTTTARASIAAGVTTMMAAFIATNPTLIRRHFSERPTTFATDLPCSFLSARPETISHTSGTRERVFSPSVSVVWDGRTTLADMDATVDLLVDHFTAYPHIVTGTIWDRMTVEDDREVIGDGVSLPSVRFTFSNLSIREGRT